MSSRLHLYIATLVALITIFPLAGSCIRRIGEVDTRRVLAAGERLKAVATTGMVGELVRNVGGSDVELTVMMGAGVDPHSYKARESDVLAIAGADLVFVSGLHLEAKLGEVLERMGGRVTTVAVTSGLDESSLLGGNFSGHPDPHVWFDVELWSSGVAEVRKVLSQFDPANAAAYATRAASYEKQLVELHEYVMQTAQRVPSDQRVLVTAHDAFGYFGKAYGFEVLGLQGISTQAEAGTADVRNLAELIARRKIPAIFVESSVPRRNIQAVQEAVQARGFEVVIGGELFSDAMGVEGTHEGTYIGMVEHNINTIVNALLMDTNGSNMGAKGGNDGR